MKNRATPAFLLLVVLPLACKKQEAAEPAASPVPPPLASAKAPPPRPPFARPARPTGPSPTEVKPLLTEDKVTRFATYQKEISTMTTEAVGVGLSAHRKAGTDPKKLEKAVVADDRSATLAAASQAALKKSGLTQNEVTKLTQVLTPYYSRLYALERMFGRSGGDETPAKKPGAIAEAMARVREKRAARAAAVRQEFSERYGEDALALVKQHEPEFFAINEKMMNAAMGAMAKPQK
jgi:hypothetical protein